MKDFFKYVLATVVGLFVFGIVMAILGMMSIVGMVASGEATQNVSKNTVLVLNMNGAIEEQGEDNFMSTLTGQPGTTGLDDILSAIKKAKDNDRIKGIYIEAGALSTSFATLQEIRNALNDFKESGKWIIAFADTYTQGTYYLATVADKIFMNPKGMLDWHGMGAQPMYVKDLAGKFGVKFQVIKVGTFKSATEMYTETKMSDANRLQTEAYVNGLWEHVLNTVSESRGISIDSLNSYADRMLAFDEPENLIKYHFIDSLLYADELKAEVKKMLDIDSTKTVPQVSVADMRNVKGTKKKGEQIAIYHAYGDIVDQASGSLMSQGGHQIIGNDVCKDLQQLADDDDVKAVVLRVNSPGGSAYASEQIWHAVQNLKAKKPVVVSMGDYAASGGYYISCAADWIIAQPTTLTGSIGIFGVIPDVSELMTKKLSLHFDEIKTNRNSLFGTTSRPMNAEETSIMQGYINRGYSLFRQRVADGRQQPVDSIEQIAQGRVWLGQAALDIKLVDQLGGINDAVTKAAELAGLEEYHTTGYPAPADFFEQFMSDAKGGGNYLDEQMRMTLGELYEPMMFIKTATEQNPIQARMPFFMTIK